MNSLTRVSLAALLLTSLWGCSKNESGKDTTGTATNTEDETRFESRGDSTSMPAMTPTGPTAASAPENITETEIRAVQTALQRLGYDVNNNGKDSAETAQAVERFQKSKGLSPTGRIDRSTLEALNIPLQETEDRTPASAPQGSSMGDGSLQQQPEKKD